MNRLRFRVVTGILIFLVGVVLFRVSFEKYIPPAKMNLRLESALGEYMASGARQAIDWRPLTPQVFTEARQLARPIFMVIGTPWDRLGRSCDDTVFNNPEVQRLIGRGFLPVRVDAAQKPEWLTAFLPYQRIRTPFLSTFYIVILDTQGRVIDGFLRGNSGVDMNESGLLTLLEHASKVFEDEELRHIEPQIMGIQKEDYRLLREPITSGLPEFGQMAAMLSDRGDTYGGGFPTQDMRAIVPAAWEFQAQCGRWSDLQQTLGPILHSRLYDPVDGGFRTLESVSDRRVEFDKLTIQNARMFDLLVTTRDKQLDPAVPEVINGCFEYLKGQIRADGDIAAGTPGDDRNIERSPHSSFSIRKLSNGLSVPERTWASTNLGLDPGRNRQMIPYLATSESATTPEIYQSVLKNLRKLSGARPVPQEYGLLDVHGTVAARILHAARIAGNPEWMKVGVELMEELNEFQSGDELTHVVSGDSAYLGDYLAFADACLQDFLANGRVISLEAGADTLLRCMKMYRLGTGVVLNQPLATSEELAPDRTVVPEVVDTRINNATTSIAIRLLSDYGRLLGQSSRGKTFGRYANELMGAGSNLTSTPSLTIASYYAASAHVADNSWLGVSGPNAKSVADRLARLRPLRLVSPIIGPVRSDLARRPNGIYLFSEDRVVGPLTEKEALQRFPATFALGVLPN